MYVCIFSFKHWRAYNIRRIRLYEHLKPIYKVTWAWEYYSIFTMVLRSFISIYNSGFCKMRIMKSNRIRPMSRRRPVDQLDRLWSCPTGRLLNPSNWTDWQPIQLDDSATRPTGPDWWPKLENITILIHLIIPILENTLLYTAFAIFPWTYNILVTHCDVFQCVLLSIISWKPKTINRHFRNLISYHYIAVGLHGHLAKIW